MQWGHRKRCRKQLKTAKCPAVIRALSAPSAPSLNQRPRPQGRRNILFDLLTIIVQTWTSAPDSSHLRWRCQAALEASTCPSRAEASVNSLQLLSTRRSVPSLFRPHTCAVGTIVVLAFFVLKPVTQASEATTFNVSNTIKEPVLVWTELRQRAHMLAKHITSTP